MSDLAILVGGLISAFGLGFVVGMSFKAVRRFLDSV